MNMILHSLDELRHQLAADKKRAIKAAEEAVGEAAKAIQENASDKISAYPGASQDLRESIVSQSDGLEAVVGSNAPGAARQEFGTESIPPGPFLAPAAIENQDATQRIIGEAVLGAFTRK